MDYDLSRLNPRDFEHLVQSLARAAIGPGISIFGDGPDGGREAVLEGRTSFPTAADGWDGYLVLQAKFNQRAGDARHGGTWFLHQLERELKRYANAKARRRPDYLLFATNVVLTPPTGGFKDKVAERMERARAELGLRGWHVWAYDELRTLLDRDEEVRRTYAAWVTPGDVLHEVLAHFGPAAHDFEQTISTFLQKAGLADQYANLEQAGHAVEEKLSLGQVFVDLPMHPDLHDRGRTARHPRGTSVACVAHLLKLSGRQSGALPASARDAAQRVVLVGGPGQGKSTVGQFLCQLHRMALLEARDPRTLAPEAQQVLATVADCAQRDRLPRPQARRFPVRVALNAFAAALADDDGPRSLLEYLTQRLEERTGDAVPLSLFRRWLADYPWLIVLDGLDEVPPSSNRDAVLTAINDFWVDAAVVESDVLVVATTRPQGYSEDFSPELYAHYRLQPLRVSDALRYGRRLADQRHRTDPDRSARVKQRLERAVRDDATRRLMQSPLQVTIMTALVEGMGRPPQERWGLFREYYDVIYRREMERDIPAADILRRRRSDVDAIHQRVALLLQVKSEHAQQTEAHLSQEQLATVVEQRLASQGHTEPKLSALRDGILEAAAQRLVFLVGLQHDRVGFEIRSLQEYMAAECLMDGPDARVVERLDAIAGISSWRNVTLFAAGHCYAQREHLRDTVFRICYELNTSVGDPLARSRLAGSVLAIDLLMDGPAREQPGFESSIVQEAARAFRGMALRGQSVADAYHDGVSEIFSKALEEAVGDRPVCGALEGWKALLKLDRAGVPWASELAERYWPTDPGEVVDLWCEIEMLPLSERAEAGVLSALEAQPFATINAEAELIEGLIESGRSPVWWPYVERLEHPDQELASIKMLTEEVGPGWEVLLSPLRMSHGPLRDAAGLHLSWLPIALGERFAADPSAARLAAALREIAERCEPAWWSHLPTVVSWPLGACLAFSADAEQLRALAAAADAGALGDAAAWSAAEARWTRDGVTRADLLHTAGLTDRPWDERIALRGFPLHMPAWSRSSSFDRVAADILRDVYASVRAAGNRALLAGFLRRFVMPFGRLDSGEATFAEHAEWSAASGGWPQSVRPDQVVRWLVDDQPIDLRQLDALGRSALLDDPMFLQTFDEADEPALYALAGGVRAKPGYTGLWVLLAGLTRDATPDVAQRIATQLAGVPSPRDQLARASANVLRLYSPLERDDASPIATAIAAGAKLHATWIRRILPLADAMLSPSTYEIVLALLADAVPCEALALRAWIASVADDLLRRRTSPLNRSDTWEALGLFAREDRLLSP